MDRAARAMDVCVHLPSGRRRLVVAVRPDGSLDCVDADDRPFACGSADLVSYRHPGYEKALCRAAYGRTSTPGRPR